MGGRLALQCDDSGRVLRVIRDDLEIVEDSSRSGMLPAMATSEGSLRCFEMLDALRKESAVFGWLIELRAPSGPIGLHFAGVQRDHEVLLVASEDLSDVPTFTDELQRMNNEHVARLRELVKERARSSPPPGLLPSMTDLNNANTTLEREVLRQKRALEELLRSKNELLGMVAHDLRNPLATVAGLLEVMRLDEAVDASHRSLLEEAEETVSVMTRIVAGVLDVSAIESGVLALDATPCDLAQIVSRAVSLHRRAAARAGVTIELDARTAIPIVADETKLHQVVDNLVSNAIKHCPRETTVCVAADLRDDRGFVSVTDQGPGIPEARWNEIFEPWSRGEPSASGNGGVGLGLAIARRIAVGHGGRLEVERSDGGGSRFVLSIPRRPAENAPPT